MRRFAGALALSSAITVFVAPVAYAEAADGDANVAVFKVLHKDGSVIAAYDCTKGDSATITVKVTYKTSGAKGSGSAENLECTGKPTFVTIKTDLGPGEHGDKVTSDISIKAEGSEPAIGESFAVVPADGTAD
ncbi:hypothetical protein F3087_01930 [Nocardia colli]|uniref:Uncharacterized protein n=1 Tax=Nocardia colli TaxID=2545717 RepID=A0A5N0EMR5_9NOCA|nr:hypothetical protein [Nocardia colli]KAA8890099.1 hypothetical protein F3087_01930 [Nocardia colli]